MNLLHMARAAAPLLAWLATPVRAALPTVPTTVAVPVQSFGAGGLLQAGFGLAFVIGLIFLCAWVARRFGLQQHGSNRRLKVVSSVMVGQRERVVVVEIGQSWLVLGVSPGRVNALHAMPAEQTPAIENAPHPAGGGATPGVFAERLRESLAKMGRRP